MKDCHTYLTNRLFSVVVELGCLNLSPLDMGGYINENVRKLKILCYNHSRHFK